MITITEGRHRVNATFAVEICREHRYERQRKIQLDHVHVLAHEMTAGFFMPGSQLVFIRTPDGRLHMIDGNHRLFGVMQADADIEFTFLINDVNSYDELHEAYARLDTVQRKRTAPEVMQSTGISESLEIQKRTGVAAYAAGAIISQHMSVVNNRSRRYPPGLSTPDGRLAAIKPWWKQVVAYDRLIRKAERVVKKQLLNGSVTAVALVTLEAQEKLATEFWKGVADFQGLELGDPRRTLTMALINRNFAGDAAHILGITCVAWNHWYTRSPIKSLRMPVKPFLLGTMFGLEETAAPPKAKLEAPVTPVDATPVERAYFAPWDGAL